MSKPLNLALNTKGKDKVKGVPVHAMKPYRASDLIPVLKG
jgi:hypothetical protein